MARSRNKRGMGPLLKEMRSSPVAAVVNGVLGIGGILAVGIAVAREALEKAESLAPDRAGQKLSQGKMLLYGFIGGVSLLAGIGFLLFALLQITTSIRIFGRGMIWRRFGRKRVISWIEVAHFGLGDAAAESWTSWRMVLHNGEVIVFHSILYNRSEFAETMELIAEQIEETHQQYG